MSSLHAVLERYPSGWALRDLGSLNGTFVNSEEVAAERRLRAGDEIQLGSTRILFRGQTPARRTIGARRLPDPATERDGGRPGCGVFRREGDFWTVGFDGIVVRIRDSKGARHLAELLTRPGREVHVADLVGAEWAGSAPIGDAGEILDAQARRDYERRLLELEEEVEEAESFSDLERAALAREEIDALTRALAEAVGLGGRGRLASSASERARWSVTRALRTTIRRIAEDHPCLGKHLQATVSTGTFCSYNPDPRAAVSWETR